MNRLLLIGINLQMRRLRLREVIYLRSSHCTKRQVIRFELYKTGDKESVCYKTVKGCVDAKSWIGSPHTQCSLIRKQLALNKCCLNEWGKKMSRLQRNHQPWPGLPAILPQAESLWYHVFQQGVASGGPAHGRSHAPRSPRVRGPPWCFGPRAEP